MTLQSIKPLFELRYFDARNRFDIFVELLLFPTIMIFNIWKITTNDFKFAFWSGMILLSYIYLRTTYRNIKTPLLEIRPEYIAYKKKWNEITTIIPKSHVIELTIRYGTLKIQTLDGKSHSISIPVGFTESCKAIISGYITSPVPPQEMHPHAIDPM